MTIIQPPQSHAADVFSDLPTLTAAENNKGPILDKWLELEFNERKVLEIGSGTGQQAIHLSQHCYQLRWQPTEVKENFERLNQWWEASQKVGIINFLEPIEYQVGEDELPTGDYDTIYTSNVLHIISRANAKQLVEQVCGALKSGQKWICYGPFMQNNKFTTDSNKEFNDWLLSEGHGGLMDLEDVVKLSKNKLEIETLADMPANNFFVVFNRK